MRALLRSRAAYYIFFRHYGFYYSVNIFFFIIFAFAFVRTPKAKVKCNSKNKKNAQEAKGAFVQKKAKVKAIAISPVVYHQVVTGLIKRVNVF
jgi:hypothetical protein